MNYWQIPALLFFGAVLCLQMLNPAQSNAMPFVSGHPQHNTDAGKQALSYEDLLTSGREYFQTGEYAAAKKDFYKALKLAQDDKEEQRINQINFELAYLYNVINQFDTAVTLYRQVIDYYKEQEDTVGLGTVLSSYGSALYDMGSEDEAMKIFYRAVDFLKASGRYKNLGAAYENIAMINIDLGYEQRGIRNYRQALQAYQQMEDPSYVISVYANLGVSYKNIQKPDSALYYYHLSDSLAGMHDLYAIKAQNLFNIGNIYYDQGKQEQARAYYDQSLEICLQHDLVFGQYHNYLGRGENAIEQGDAQQAIAYLTKAYNLARQNEFPNQGVLYELLAEAYHTKGDYQKAFFFSDQLVAFNDSLYQAQKHKELMELQAKYNLKQKEADILRLQKQVEIDKLRQLKIIGFFVILLIILVAVLIWNWQKRMLVKQKHRLAAKENERMKIKSETQNKELVSLSLLSAQLQDFYNQLTGRVSQLQPYIKQNGQKELQDVLHFMHENSVNKKAWDNFHMRFKESNQDFVNNLIRLYPELTQTEIRLCELLYLDLTTKEIARMTNRSVRTVENLRYRIRNKFQLHKDTSLVNYLHHSIPFAQVDNNA